MDTEVFWLLFDPTNIFKTDIFLYLYTSRASRVSIDPDLVLDRFEVVFIWLNKVHKPPQHEFLIIETRDRQENDTI